MHVSPIDTSRKVPNPCKKPEALCGPTKLGNMDSCLQGSWGAKAPRDLHRPHTPDDSDSKTWQAGPWNEHSVLARLPPVLGKHQALPSPAMTGTLMPRADDAVTMILVPNRQTAHCNGSEAPPVRPTPQHIIGSWQHTCSTLGTCRANFIAGATLKTTGWQWLNTGCHPTSDNDQSQSKPAQRPKAERSTAPGSPWGPSQQHHV